MMSLVLQYIATDMVSALWRAPIWWYGQGLLLALDAARGAIKNYARTISIGVWMKNLFVPMFGLYDWQSRIISFFIRVVQIVARAFMFLVWILVVIVALFIYLLLPVAAIVAFFYFVLQLFA